MISLLIADERIVLNMTVPVYKAVDDVAPPSAASAAVITGNKSFPYSVKDSTVVIANDINDREDVSNNVPTEIVDAKSTACVDMLLKFLRRAVIIQIQIIETSVFNAL